MGIADRDYARQPSPYGRSGSARVGRMRAMSVNTWIIVINVIVFIAGHLVLPLVGESLRQAKSPWARYVQATEVSTGHFYRDGVTSDQRKREIVDYSQTTPLPRTTDFYHPIYDPKTSDGSGRPLSGGAAGAFQIGYERVHYFPPLDGLGHFSSGKAMELQVWRFLTFQFLHADITHILFNMMGLWFVGGLVEEYLGRRRYLAYYLVCGLFGAVSYLILNVLGFVVLSWFPGLRESVSVPALLFEDIYMPLIGASAGVFGVLMAAAYIAPRAPVEVMFVIPMKLRTAVYLFLGIAVLNLLLRGHNAGGDAAHVGGAIAGAFLIRRPHLLRDFFDLFGDSRKSGRRGGSKAAEIDSILAKVREKGLESLTPMERETLRRESEAARERYAD